MSNIESCWLPIGKWTSHSTPFRILAVSLRSKRFERTRHIAKKHHEVSLRKRNETSLLGVVGRHHTALYGRLEVTREDPCDDADQRGSCVLGADDEIPCFTDEAGIGAHAWGWPLGQTSQSAGKVLKSICSISQGPCMFGSGEVRSVKNNIDQPPRWRARSNIYPSIQTHPC